MRTGSVLIGSALWLAMSTVALAGPVAYFSPTETIPLDPTPKDQARMGLRGAYGTDTTLALPIVGLAYGLRPNFEVGMTTSLNMAGLGTQAFGSAVSGISPWVKYRVPVAGGIGLGWAAGTTIPVAPATGGSMGWVGILEIPNPIASLVLNAGVGAPYSLATVNYGASLAFARSFGGPLHLFGEVTFNGDSTNMANQLAERLGLLVQWSPGLATDLSVRAQQSLAPGSNVFHFVAGTTATF